MLAKISIEEVAVLGAVLSSFMEKIDVSKLNKNEVIAMTIGATIVDELKLQFDPDTVLDMKKTKELFNNAIAIMGRNVKSIIKEKEANTNDS